MRQRSLLRGLRVIEQGAGGARPRAARRRRRTRRGRACRIGCTRRRTPVARSKCHGGSACAGAAAQAIGALSSACRISLGSMRASSAPDFGQRHVAQVQPPSGQIEPRDAGARAVVACSATSRLSRLPSSRPASVSVPGVTMRATLRSTGPLLVAGSPICSQIATDSPEPHQLGQILLDRVVGHAGHRDRRPGRCPRAVSVMSSSGAARCASS